MLKKWEILKNEKVFRCPWFNVQKEKCKLPDGQIIDDYFIIENPSIVTIIPFTEDGKIITLKEYKHGLKGFTYTFPSGIMEENEIPIDSAKRELAEETGFSGDLMQIAKTAPNPTSSRFFKYTFVTTDAKKTTIQNLDNTEFLEVNFFSIDKVFDLIDSEKIVSDLSICSFYTALRHLNLI